MRPNAPLRLAVLAALFTAALPAQAQSWLWALGGGGPLADEGTNVVVDAAGNPYVTGYFSGRITLGPFTLTSPGLDQEFFLVKLSPEREVLWARSGGGASDDIGYGLALSPDGGVYVGGRFQETATFGDTTLVSAGGWDFFLARYSPAGELLWARSGGGLDNDEGFGLASDADGNVYANGLFFEAAAFGGTTLTAAGGRDVFVVKYSPAGELLWARSGGGPDNDIGYGVTVDAGGNVYACGRFWETASFGDFTLTGVGNFDAFLVKYSPEGDVLWARQGGSLGGERAYAVAVDTADDVYLTGRFEQTATFGALTLTSEGGMDVFLVKYSPEGDVLWGRSGGGDGDDVGRAVVTDANDDIYVTGRIRGTATFGGTSLVGAGHNDVFLARYSPEGDLRWLRGGGGGGNDGGSGLDLDAAGNAYVTGYLTNLASFGPLALAGSGGLDVLVAKYGTSMGVPALISVAAAPVSPPVVVGPGNGAFDFTVTLSNASPQPRTFQVWTALTGPVGREPLFGPLTLTLPAGARLTHTLEQWIPGIIPAGTYTYHVRLGSFPAATAGAAFTFEKVAGDPAGTWETDAAEDWDVRGWSDLTEAASGTPPPRGYALSEARPNPFTRQATLTLEVVEAQHVTAEVLDVLGRRVAVLLDGPVAAGAHALVVEAGALPSGRYVVRVAGEHFSATRRLVLLR